MKIQRKFTTGGLALLALLAIAGCSSSKNPRAVAPPDDSIPPTVSAVQLQAGAVSRVAVLAVTATDNTAVTQVRFFVDGTLLGSDATSPYSIEWDTSAVTDGEHMLSAEAVDALGNVGESAEITVTVANTQQFAVTLGGDQENPPRESAATGQANFTVNLVTGAIEGEVTSTGLVPTAAHIHTGFAGDNGGVRVGLEQDPADATHFTVPAGATLDEAGIDLLLTGGLYVNVHTSTAPSGAIRGQILPEGYVVRFTELSGEQEVPQVDTLARGRAGITVDQLNGRIIVQVSVTDLSGSAAHVHTAYAGSTGGVLVPLQQDATDSNHWFVEDGTLNAAGLEAFAAGRLYVNVHSEANSGGEIRGQILPEGITLLMTELSGEQAVPAILTDADGVAALTLDAAASLVTIHVNNRGLDDATNAHLHGAYGGTTGGVQVPLTQDGSKPAHWFAEQAALTAEQLAALLNGATYVNVHSSDYPGGEIRGQVIPEGILFALGRLEGGQVVPPILTDAGGTFAVTIDTLDSTLVAHVNTSGLDDATNAHLHSGYAGVGGGVAIGLTQDGTNPARWSAVAVPLDAAQLLAVSSGGYYVNVHSPAYPGGEVRGQVAPPPVEVRFTNVSGAEEVPPVIGAASGIAASTVNRDTGLLTLYLNATGVDDATAAHIHLGWAGQSGGVLIPLAQNAVNLGRWSVVGEQLDANGLADYLAGHLYVNLHTPANPAGAIRGQIAPQDIRVLISAMDGGQVVPAVVTANSGLASTTVDLKARSLVAFVNGVGVDDATGASIRLGGLGENGDEVLALAQNPTRLSQWSGISERLDPGAFSSYRAGRLYAEILTPAQPAGELRGQIVPADAADFDDQAPTVSLASPGANVSGVVTLTAEASDDQGVVQVRFLFDGLPIGTDTTAPYSVDWDTAAASNGTVSLTAEAADAAGNIGVSAAVAVTVENAAPVTLTQIQAQIFSPTCSACHSGVASPSPSGLPGILNLTTAAASYAAIVGNASLQVGALNLVEPNDPDNSYLVQKIEGTAAVGVQMPAFMLPLEPAMIEMVRSWISDGAQNN